MYGRIKEGERSERRAGKLHTLTDKQREADTEPRVQLSRKPEPR